MLRAARLRALATVILLSAPGWMGGCPPASDGIFHRNGGANANRSGGRICGGIAGLSCPEGEYCRLDPGQCCCDFDGTCTPVPSACPLIFAPVCGCDGRTCGNECEAAAAGMSIDHAGECP
ncbi:MAG TPA: Kazal domain-containing protein [Phycisphaerae bacterium]